MNNGDRCPDCGRARGFLLGPCECPDPLPQCAWCQAESDVLLVHIDHIGRTAQVCEECYLSAVQAGV